MQKMCQWKLQWGENHHHLRRQTGLIHCISNVQVVTAAVHHNKKLVSPVAKYICIGRYNSTTLHTVVCTHVPAAAMWLLYVHVPVLCHIHPWADATPTVPSSWLEEFEVDYALRCHWDEGAGYTVVWSYPPPLYGRCTLKCMLAALCCWASTPMYTRIATKDTDIHTDNNTRTSCYVSIYNIPNVLIRCDCS